MFQGTLSFELWNTNWEGFRVPWTPFTTLYETRKLAYQWHWRFSRKVKNTRRNPKEAILITTDVLAFYPSIAHDEGLKVLRTQYAKWSMLAYGQLKESFKILPFKTLVLEKIHRFIGQVFFTWTDTEENVEIAPQFLKRIKWPIVFLVNLRMVHQYFHYDLCHAEHIKRSIAFSQALRLKIKMLWKNDLDSNVENLKEWFRKRG